MFGTSFQKSVSQNDLPDLDSLVQIKNRDTKSSPNCSGGPSRARATIVFDALAVFRLLERSVHLSIWENDIFFYFLISLSL
mgnify:CR=1 FL=1